MLVLGVAAALLPSAFAQFVSPPTNFTATKGYLDIPVRYKQVPNGVCETDPDVKSFSGYVDVEENEHIFFWFFEARNEDPEKAPLTVWINGGEYFFSFFFFFIVIIEFGRISSENSSQFDCTVVWEGNCHLGLS